MFETVSKKTNGMDPNVAAIRRSPTPISKAMARKSASGAPVRVGDAFARLLDARKVLFVLFVTSRTSG